MHSRHLKMATSTSDKSPLLVNIEDDSVDVLSPKSQVRHSSVRSGISEGRTDTDNEGVPESDDIVAIFVVAFDTRSGNIVEWCQPDDINLDGVEFKAMASGSHTVLTDFIYFRKDKYYGLSCFENMPVDSAAERGARMKSVGVLSTSYTTLHRHMNFLEHQVRHLLHSPGSYEDLKAFFGDHKASLPLSREASWDGISSALHNTSSPVHNASPITSASHPTPPSSDEHHPHMKITHPAGCFSQFLSFFGEQIFTLWKCILLRKRVLFFSPPPIGVVCYKVYCASLMSHHDVLLNSAIDQKPYFYVNIADIDTLESEMSYIACTTEKIFQEKQRLYDVYVDNQNVTTHTANLKDLLRPNDMDREKFMRLNNQRATAVFNAREQGVEPSSEEDDEIFANFFLEQNNHIFQTLLEISSTEDKSLTNDHMKAMGLDPIGDRHFIVDLLEIYGIDVILMIDTPCCPV